MTFVLGSAAGVEKATLGAFSVAVWNMDSWRRKGNPKGWEALRRLEVDVMLLNEATRPQGGVLGVKVHGKTKDRERDNTCPWSSRVASRYPMEPVDARVNGVPFQTARPGSWTASVVSIPRASGTVERVTAVSLYGLLDEMSDASVHRSLTELAAICDDRGYNRLILLGGDLNTWTGVEPRHRTKASRAGSSSAPADRGI